MAHLRLDMYVNGREYMIAECPVSESGYEEALNASAVVNAEIAVDIRAHGGSVMNQEMLTEKMLDILWDVTGKEITTEEITFCMCLWEGDEHIRSMVTLPSIQ